MQPPAFAQQPGAGASAYAQQQQQQQQMPAQQSAYQAQQQVQQQAPAFAQQQQQHAQAARPPAAAPRQNGAPAAAAAPQTAPTAAPAPAASASSAGRTLPAFDLYLDLPHPAASEGCPPRVVIVPPPASTSDGHSAGEEGAANRKIADELSGDNTLARIARFAFPEFDDQAHATEMAQKPQMPPNSGAGLNRHDLYLLTPGSPASCHHTFAMQLSTGARVYGHVRRYLPPNANAKARYDVGRRGIRASVVLTRGSGGERFYAAVLKTVEAIGSQEMALESRPSLQSRPQPQQTFLQGVYHNHRALCAKYAAAGDEMANKPNVITMSALEFGNKPYSVPVDTFKLLVPTALLHAHSEIDALSTTSSQLLPLLRCVGVSNALRLLSALLCERRVVLTSRSPARLTGCARGALSMLAQGVLAWQHVYVPMLPPGMMTYLAAPMPYLVGVLASHAPAISRIPGLGEVLVFNLDTNEMECINVSNPQSFIPDLLRPAIQPDYGQPYVSLAEILGQDLAECIKTDKGSGYGPTNVQDKVGAAASIAAGKANNLFKGAMKRIKKQSSKITDSQRSFATSEAMSQRSNMSSMGDVVEQAMEQNGIGGVSSREASLHSSGGVDANGQQQDGASAGPAVPPETNYTFGEGYENEASEEEARIAFTSFFLCILGDMRWYLTQPGPGQPPVLDKDKFVAERRRAGDAEGTPMYPLLSTFVQTQIFEQFANARVEEVRARQPVKKDAPLFLLASNYHRVQRMDFSHLNVRRVVRQVAQTENPSQYLIDWDVAIRRKAMALTSNSRNEPAVPQALAEICAECNECGYILVDVMAVIWERIRDSRATQWKHALFALQLLRELLLHGPLTVVTEAEDGIDKIRDLKSYDFALRAQNSAQIRQMASHVYDMIVDRAKLFTQRRAAANSRRRGQLPRPRPPPKDARLRVNMRLADIHNLVRPSFIAGSARVAPAPPPPSQGQDTDGQMAAPAPSAYATDLLSMGAVPALRPPAQQQQVSRRDTFAPQTSTDELADIFSAASVTSAAPKPPASVPAAQPVPAPAAMPTTHGAPSPSMQQMQGSVPAPTSAAPTPAIMAQPAQALQQQYRAQQQQMPSVGATMPSQPSNQPAQQYVQSSARPGAMQQQAAHQSAPAMQGYQQPMQGYGQQQPQQQQMVPAAAPTSQAMAGYRVPHNQQLQQPTASAAYPPASNNYGQQQQHPGMYQHQQQQQQYPGAAPSQQAQQKVNLNNLAQFDPFK